MKVDRLRARQTGTGGATCLKPARVERIGHFRPDRLRKKTRFKKEAHCHMARPNP